MLPLRDTIRSYSTPIINLSLIGINTLVFLYEISLPSGAFNRFIFSYGMVPASLHIDAPLALLANPAPLLTLFTHMFLHGGWFHFLSNVWVLFIFGDNVEDRMGSWRYLVFYLVSGLVAGLLQALVAPASQVPAIGASGAIAGVLGAYFVLYPRARIVTLIPIFLFPWFVEIPALFFLGFWFVSQLFSGLSALTLSASQNMGGVAWWAHIGGFLFGMFLYRLFTPRVHPAYTRRFLDDRPFD
jgi:membrane associated rhomboid family serine protease